MTEPMNHETWVQWYLDLGASREVAQEKASRMVNGFPSSASCPTALRTMRDGRL